MEFSSAYPDRHCGDFWAEVLALASQAPQPLNLVEHLFDYWLDRSGAQA